MEGIHLPTPRSEDSMEMSTKELRSSSMSVQVSSGGILSPAEEREFLQYLKMLILSIRHGKMAGEELDLFLNSAADQLDAWSAAVPSRSIARGFVLLGKEIGGISQELRAAEAQEEQKQLQLAAHQLQVQKLTAQYRELQEQLQATSSFSRLTETKGSLPTISFSGASAVKSQISLEESQVEKERFREQVGKLQNELLIARKEVAETRRHSADEASRAQELERRLKEAEEAYESEMKAFAEAQREAMNEARAREEDLEEQIRQISDQVLAAEAEQSLQVPKLKELLRTALEQEATLLKQLREMQLEQALKTSATGQEERVFEHQEQISSLQAQLQEMQHMLHQVKKQHQEEVSDLKEQLECRTGQVGSDNQTEAREAARNQDRGRSRQQGNPGERGNANGSAAGSNPHCFSWVRTGNCSHGSGCRCEHAGNMKNTDPEYGRQMRPRSSSNDSRPGAKETVATCKHDGCDKAQTDSPTNWNKGYCSNACANKARKAKAKEAEELDKPSTPSPAGSKQTKGVLKKDEQVRHAMARSLPAAADLLSIYAALHEEMGTIFQARADDIGNVRDHVLTIQTTPIRAGEFDDIELLPCDCGICRAKGDHVESEISGNDKVRIGSVTDDGVIEKESGKVTQGETQIAASGQEDDPTPHVRVDERDPRIPSAFIGESSRIWPPF